LPSIPLLRTGVPIVSSHVVERWRIPSNIISEILCRRCAAGATKKATLSGRGRGRTRDVSQCSCRRRMTPHFRKNRHYRIQLARKRPRSGRGPIRECCDVVPVKTNSGDVKRWSSRTCLLWRSKGQLSFAASQNPPRKNPLAALSSVNVAFCDLVHDVGSEVADGDLV
jgi:hypothetical protein